jgi:hypothetical protein
MTDQQSQPTRKVGILLGIGIFLLPIIFAWFTLRKGHSTLARIISFAWLVITLIAYGMGASGGQPTATPALAPMGAPDAVAVQPVRRSDQITLAQYSQLQSGMSYAEVVEILGREGEEMSSSDVAGIRTVMYGWSNRGGANMNAMFQQGELVQKAQFGLR